MIIFIMSSLKSSSFHNNEVFNLSTFNKVDIILKFEFLLYPAS